MGKKKFDSFVFTHIPKCGGTSFREYVWQCAEASGLTSDDVYIPGINGIRNNKNIPELSKEELSVFRSMNPRVIACHCKFDVATDYELNLDNIFYYTILRDPIKRFISHYNFFYFHLGYNNCKGVRLNDLPEETLDFLVKSLANIQVSFLSNVKHPKVVGFETMCKVAKYNLQHEYASYGILEQMKASKKLLKETCDLIDFDLDLEFPRKNEFTEVSKEKLEPSDEVKEKIEMANKFDMDLYKFAVDQFNKSMEHIDQSN